MPAHTRTVTATLAASAIAVLSAMTASAAAAAVTNASGVHSMTSKNTNAGQRQVVPAVKPGLTGNPITLANNTVFSGYDAGMDASGTAYIGWIGNSGPGRKINLCTLPRGAKACKNGIQTVDSLGDSSASGLRVLVTPAGHVTLVWFHDAATSEMGPEGSEIAITTSQSGGPLSAPQDVAFGPSFGSMLDAEFAPNGDIWVLTQPTGLGHTMQLRPGFSHPPVTVTARYLVGTAKLAFSGSTAVIAVDEAGRVTAPVSFSSSTGTSFPAFRTVARTWTSDANFGLAHTPSGIRLIATENNADYHPVVSRFTGSGFSPRTLTGDFNNCSPSSHDVVSDASGRLADVSIECGTMAVANLTDTLHAADVRIPVHGTFADGDPQLTTAPSGRAWVVWSIESNAGDKLFVAPMLLPGRIVTVTKSSGADKVTLTGPASCMPQVSLGLGLTGTPAGSVTSKVLKLNGTTLHSTTLNGGSLTPLKNYTLTGTVTFSGGHTVTATLKFRACRTP